MGYLDASGFSLSFLKYLQAPSRGLDLEPGEHAFNEVENIN